MQSIGSEGSPHRGWFLSDYERSKFEAERGVFATAGETGLEVVSMKAKVVKGKIQEYRVSLKITFVLED